MGFSNLHSTFVVRLSMAKPSHTLEIVADPVTRKMPTRPFAAVCAEAGNVSTGRESHHRSIDFDRDDLR
jgi:hypothetical protein